MPVVRIIVIDKDGAELFHHDLGTVDHAIRFARAQLEEGQGAGARLITGNLDVGEYGRPRFTAYSDGLALLLSLDESGHTLEMVG